MDDPSDPMAYWPAADRWSAQLGRYITVGALAAYLYDWLLSVLDEILVCQNVGFSWPLLAYFLSRFAHETCFSILLL